MPYRNENDKVDVRISEIDNILKLYDFEKKELVFKVGNKIIIDKEEHTIRTYRYHKIFDMIKSSFYIFINNFFVRKCCHCFWIPINNSFTAVD